MPCSSNIADTLIPKATDHYIFIKAGNTQDIINSILEADKTAYKDLSLLAPKMLGKNVYDTCRNAWNFLKCNIAYQLDPLGYQYIKMPRQAWKDKKADCKSYSLFLGALLKNLNIPYVYRFTSYNKFDTDVTHVYIVAFDKNGKEIIIDGCMGGFDRQKPYESKKDFKMTKIYVVQGLPEEGQLNIGDIRNVSEAEMYLALAKQALETDKKNMQKLGHIGAHKAPHYDDQIEVIDDALQVVRHPKMTEAEKMDHLAGIADDAAEGIYGICCNGSINGVETREWHRVHRIKSRPARIRRRKMLGIHGMAADSVGDIGKIRLGKFFKKVAKGIKKVALAPLKLLKATATLPIKGILEVALPKAAPFFLYLFITNPTTISQLPPVVKRKRDVAVKLSNFIINAIGMKRDHFMALIRNGCTKHFGTSPETYLSKHIKGSITGIGLLPLAVIIPALIKVIGAIAKLLHKKPPVPVNAGDAPSDSDFNYGTDAAAASSGQDYSSYGYSGPTPANSTNDYTSNTSSGSPSSNTGGGSSAAASQLEQHAPSSEDFSGMTDSQRTSLANAVQQQQTSMPEDSNFAQDNGGRGKKGIC